MDLRQLRFFVILAETRHFGRAAARMHIAQSPLSQAIRALESHLGTPLFERTTRRVDLTAAGEALLPGSVLAVAVEGVRYLDLRPDPGPGVEVAPAWRRGDPSPALEKALAVLTRHPETSMETPAR